jgi:hypothetical protein
MKQSKKEKILMMSRAGERSIANLARATDARPSYVAAVLSQAGDLHGYHDQYSSSPEPMNIYEQDFRGRVGFKDQETAWRSVDYIAERYDAYSRAHDRAGQHHAMLVALTMFNRARWSRKVDEAQVFWNWLLKVLHEEAPRRSAPVAAAS